MSPENARHKAEGVDVIIRFHDLSRLWELERAAFSLAGQEHQPVRILLVTQRFSEEAQHTARRAVEAVIAWSPGISVAVLNFDRNDPADARSELVNLGFAEATGRYLALLDYDDVLNPEAYRLLVGRLRESEVAIAFARTPVVKADVHDGFLYARSISYPFSGESLADLFEGNFCPIHSYLMDRSRIPPNLLYFEPRLTIEEDWDFLMRLCAELPADFALRKTDIGLYFYKNDGSNTFDRDGDHSSEIVERTTTAREFVKLRRRMTPVAPAVQKALGIWPARPGLTIQDFLRLRVQGLP